MFIPPVVNAHGYDTYSEAGAKVEKNLNKMVTSTIILLVIFAASGLLNLIMCKVFQGREKRRGQIISGNLMQNQNFHEDDFGNDFEERWI